MTTRHYISFPFRLRKIAIHCEKYIIAWQATNWPLFGAPIEFQIDYVAFIGIWACLC